MRATPLLPLALLLATLPATDAHRGSDLPNGTPKPYCEWFWDDKMAHDYASPATGVLLGPPLDGNAEDCDGDGLPGDMDGHYEWAVGGAWLVARPDATLCGWPWPDHPEFPDVWIRDTVLTFQLGQPVVFHVYADTLNNLPAHDPGAPDCGDLESDHGVTCVDLCTVPFPAGLDGTYQVYVEGTMGHVGATGFENGLHPWLPKSPCPQQARTCAHGRSG